MIEWNPSIAYELNDILTSVANRAFDCHVIKIEKFAKTDNTQVTAKAAQVIKEI